MKDESILALGMLIVAVVVPFISVVPWATPLAAILAFLVFSTIRFKGREKGEAVKSLKRLNGLAQEFCSLNIETKSQDQDIKMLAIVNLVTERGSKLPSGQVHVYQNGIRVANETFEGWFDEYNERLKFFLDQPKFLKMNTIGNLTRSFRRLLFQHYDGIVEESINFINNAGVVERQEARTKFQEFRTSYNNFVDRFKIYCKDLKELGLEVHNWQPRIIAKDINVEIETPI